MKNIEETEKANRLVAKVTSMQGSVFFSRQAFYLIPDKVPLDLLDFAIQAPNATCFVAQVNLYPFRGNQGFYGSSRSKASNYPLHRRRVILVQKKNVAVFSLGLYRSPAFSVPIAGRLRYFSHHWSTITLDPWILRLSPA